MKHLSDQQGIWNARISDTCTGIVEPKKKKFGVIHRRPIENETCNDRHHHHTNNNNQPADDVRRPKCADTLICTFCITKKVLPNIALKRCEAIEPNGQTIFKYVCVCWNSTHRHGMNRSSDEVALPPSTSSRLYRLRATGLQYCRMRFSYSGLYIVGRDDLCSPGFSVFLCLCCTTDADVDAQMLLLRNSRMHTIRTEPRTRSTPIRER